ncbi:MAG: hypothetical protein ACE5MI_01995 [Acidimicrobiia bacterium]
MDNRLDSDEMVVALTPPQLAIAGLIAMLFVVLVVLRRRLQRRN